MCSSRVKMHLCGKTFLQKGARPAKAENAADREQGVKTFAGQGQKMVIYWQTKAAYVILQNELSYGNATGAQCRMLRTFWRVHAARSGNTKKGRKHNGRKESAAPSAPQPGGEHAEKREPCLRQKSCDRAAQEWLRRGYRAHCRGFGSGGGGLLYGAGQGGGCHGQAGASQQAAPDDRHREPSGCGCICQRDRVCDGG